MIDKKIILASKSPRRRELMSLITENFEVCSADVDETLENGITPENAVLYLSEIKANPFSHLAGDDSVVIGADTVVAVDGKILGKPKDNAHAFKMLKSLSGKEHSVFTGVTLLCGNIKKSFYEETKVCFYPLSDEEINEYISTGECSDKAGAYGIQGKGSLLVKYIKGDYFNVVGLPVSRLYRELKAL